MVLPLTRTLACVFAMDDAGCSHEVEVLDQAKGGL
jgi:hypothetical protein